MQCQFLISKCACVLASTPSCAWNVLCIAETDVTPRIRHVSPLHFLLAKAVISLNKLGCIHGSFLQDVDRLHLALDRNLLKRCVRLNNRTQGMYTIQEQLNPRSSPHVPFLLIYPDLAAVPTNSYLSPLARRWPCAVQL